MSNRFLEKEMHDGRTMVLLLALTAAGSSADAEEPQVRLRRPVAIAVSQDQKSVYTANRDSGSISVIDAAGRAVVGEVEIGGRLSDISMLDESHLMVLDELQHQVVLLHGGGVQWDVVSRLNVAPYPVRLHVEPGGRCFFVSSLWSRTVTRVELSKADGISEYRLRVAGDTTVGFEPRELCLTADRKRLIVAGAFQGDVSILDSTSLRSTATRSIPGHNIRGLTLSPDGQSLLIAHQNLNSNGRSCEDDVHWGNMLTNELTTAAVDEFCSSTSKRLKSRVVRYLGEPGRAAGDPGDVSIGPNGELAVAFSGVDEVAVSSGTEEYRLRRISVGRRPVAIARMADGTLFVANMFSDSISVIPPTDVTNAAEISLGPYPELSSEQVGETLFYDSRLSHDGWMSCHSCHTDGHTNGMLNDNLSDGSFGDPKRVLSLLGVAESGPWAWNGQVRTLEEQVANSIANTMQGTLPEKSHIAALAAYLEALPSPPVSSIPLDNVEAARLHQGEELFNTLDCQRCHTPPSYTSKGTYDVDLGSGKFNPPSLRGVDRRRTLFHDSRADSLTSVLRKYKHQIPRELTVEEARSLVQFLKSL